MRDVLPLRGTCWCMEGGREGGLRHERGGLMGIGPSGEPDARFHRTWSL